MSGESYMPFSNSLVTQSGEHRGLPMVEGGEMSVAGSQRSEDDRV